MKQQKILSSQQVKAEAACLGFSACGLAPAEPVAPWRMEGMKQWLAEGKHGEMDYLARHSALRATPESVFEGARTVIAVALNYYPAAALSDEGYALARYAYGRDYHDVMREKLRLLLEALSLEEYEEARICCDTAPIDERYWAWRCGLGWQGRNALFIIPGRGTYHFLAEIVCRHTADAYDHPLTAPGSSPCAACRRCIDACPAGALSEQQGIDARRCLSYLTIEHRGPLPAEASRQMGSCIYGCDRCAEACPHNHAPLPSTEPAFAPSEELRSMTAEHWKNITPDVYRRLFKGSAVKRAKYEGLLRNIRAVSEQE